MKRPAIALALVACITLPARADDVADWWQAYADDTKLVTLPDGKQLSLLCMGEGAPVVVMESGLGFAGMIGWRKVQAAIGRVTQTCAYDRAGVGKSSAADGPRDAGTAADDLAALLEAADLPAPYVLVSGSYGGYITRLYAGRHTRAVAGMLLGDPSAEHQYDRFFELSPGWAERRAAEFALGRDCSEDPRPADLAKLCQPAPPADMPPEHMAQWITNSDPVHTSHILREREAMNGVSSDLLDQEKRSLGAIPFVVLHRDPTLPEPGLSAEENKEFQPLWLQLHLQMMDLSSDSQLHVVPRSGHPINIDRPDAFINAVTDMVLKVRSIADQQ